MGQAFRRASGRIRAPSPSPSPKSRPPTTDKVEVTKRTTAAQCNNQDSFDSDGAPRVNADNVLEERDPQFDAMLSQMVGRIKSKPGGKLEMGEPAVVERYDRPMPKLRNTKPDTAKYENRPSPPGTVNVAQLRHMLLLHQGKADDHNGPMDIHQIAKKFQLEGEQVQQILQFVSLLPEDSNKHKSSQ